MKLRNLCDLFFKWSLPVWPINDVLKTIEKTMFTKNVTQVIVINCSMVSRILAVFMYYSLQSTLKTQNFMFTNNSYFNRTVFLNTHSAVKLKYRINNRILGSSVRKNNFCSWWKILNKHRTLYVHQVLVLLMEFTTNLAVKLKYRINNRLCGPAVRKKNLLQLMEDLKT